MRGFVLILEAAIVVLILATVLIIFFHPLVLHVSPLLSIIHSGDVDSVRIDSGGVPLGPCRFYTDPVTLTVASRC